MDKGVALVLAASILLASPGPAGAAGMEADARAAAGIFEAALDADSGGPAASAGRARGAFRAGIQVPAAPKAPVEPRVIPRFQQKTFPAETACGLKSFTVVDYETRSRDEDFDRSRLTLMGAVIETTSPSCIRDFGVVQFIRGCAYHARYSAETGALLEKTFDIARRLRGPRVVFNHPVFEVDRTDEDPLYASGDGEDRLGLSYVPVSPLRLKPDRASMMADLKAFDDPRSRVFLMDHPGPTSVAFVTDVPNGGVSMTSEDKKLITAANSSLDFRTCLYRIKDVPVTGEPAGEDVPAGQGGPLACFGWASRYTYDIATGEFVTDRFQGVDPFCAGAPSRAPLPE